MCLNEQSKMDLQQQSPPPSSTHLEDDSDSDYGSTLHYDVSRTVSDKSDTLGSEELDDVERLRLEFARKLGYSDSQVQIALSKLGPQPSQNELLAELIQLDSNTVIEPIQQQQLPNPKIGGPPELRHIIIDGSNVAMSHGANKIFSCQGIQIAVDYFKKRGHNEITVFVPSFRKSSSQQDEIRDPQILTQLESSNNLVFTPSRQLTNRRLVCYDDRYILKLALETDGVIVSNDNYRDLQMESPDFKRIAEERILMYSFVNDRFMPPDDPLGRNGPTLDQFLSKSNMKHPVIPCPYDRKCTYGSKCKYYHSTVKQSISEQLRKQAATVTKSLPLTTGTDKPMLNRVKSADINNGHRRLRREYSVNLNGDSRLGILGQNNCSTSETRLDTPSPGPLPLQQQQQPPSSQQYLSPFPTQPHLSQVWSPIQEINDPVYYHLVAIFPSYQVKYVMELYKEERDPQVLCRHIVRLFS